MREETQMGTTLVLGGTGKTGRRIVQRLQAKGVPVRIGTPSATPPFDWTDEEYATLLTENQVPADLVKLLTDVFAEVLDGHNAYLGDGVQRALGRRPRDFSDYVRDAAATGVWDGR
jgi:uncharacterized protein YbjT (DUF2867 family)